MRPGRDEYPAPLILAATYLCRFSQTAAGNLVVGPWLDLVARVVPEDRRGRFIGTWTMAGDVLGAAAAALGAFLLGRLPYPQNFAACFGLAFLVLLVGYLPLFRIAEPPGPLPRPARPFRRQLGELPRALAADRPFRRFLLGLALTALGAMSGSFLAVYAVGHLGVPVELAAGFTVVLLAGQVVANLLLGRLADRRGFRAAGRATALVTAGLAAIALGVGWLAPGGGAGALWIGPAFVLLGAGQAGNLLAMLGGPIEYAPPDRRPTYVALTGATVSVTAAIGPLLGARIIGPLGYEWLFGASLALSLAGAAILGPGTTRRG